MVKKLPLKDYLASLPQKRMGAGCLFFDEQGRILLVKPTYKPGWEIPGGVVELNESPQKCCEREIQEELGLQRTTSGLLVVDYNRAIGQKTESLMFIFNGGTLSFDQIAAIRLPVSELSEFRFFDVTALPEMTSTLRGRIMAAYEQSAKGGATYLENQK